MIKVPYDLIRRRAYTRGRQVAVSTRNQPVANAIHSLRHAQKECDHVHQLRLAHLTEWHEAKLNRVDVRRSTLETTRAQLESLGPEAPHPFLAPHAEGLTAKLKVPLLLIVCAAELTLTKAALDVFGDGRNETIAMSVGTLVALVVLAHMAGEALRERKTVTASVLFVSVNLANAALTWLRVMYMSLVNEDALSIPAGTASWTLLILGVTLIVFSTALGTVRESRLQKRQRVERRLAALNQRALHLAKTREADVDKERGRHDAEKTALTLGWQSATRSHVGPSPRRAS